MHTANRTYTTFCAVYFICLFFISFLFWRERDVVILCTCIGRLAAFSIYRSGSQLNTDVSFSYTIKCTLSGYRTYSVCSVIVFRIFSFFFSLTIKSKEENLLISRSICIHSLRIYVACVCFSFAIFVVKNFN